MDYYYFNLIYFFKGIRQNRNREKIKRGHLLANLEKKGVFKMGGLEMFGIPA